MEDPKSFFRSGDHLTNFGKLVKILQVLQTSDFRAEGLSQVTLIIIPWRGVSAVVLVALVLQNSQLNLQTSRIMPSEF